MTNHTVCNLCVCVSEGGVRVPIRKGLIVPASSTAEIPDLFMFCDAND